LIPSCSGGRETAEEEETAWIAAGVVVGEAAVLDAVESS